MGAVTFQKVDVDGFNVFYREAGPKDGPAILLLHGFPSAGHMFRDLIPELAEQFRVIAPDLPGFGQSDMPERAAFNYTFDNIANVIERFTEAVGSINAAIVALAKAFADRGLKDGVQVNSVSPGPVMTGRRLAMIEKAAANGISVDEAKQKLLTQAVISRYGTPEEIAELMAFLVSPAARWMTGSTLRMDGGEIKAV